MHFRPPSTARGPCAQHAWAARPAHPLPIRVMHWTGAASVICMMLSGWAIYNASPSLPFMFPRRLTLGGWLAGGIAWHISVMWVLFADGVAYLLYGGLSGHFRQDICPQGPRAVIHDLIAALTGRLGHRLGRPCCTEVSPGGA